MTTANFTYFAPLQWRHMDRTPINIIAAACKAYCYHCHKIITPNVIITPFLSLPADICPVCCQKIQHTCLPRQGKEV